jgi:hypothetical protein
LSAQIFLTVTQQQQQAAASSSSITMIYLK